MNIDELSRIRNCILEYLNQLDLYEFIYELVKQVPSGKVTTYKLLAEALGDKIAARSVGFILNKNEDFDTIPCYRVIRSDGSLGGYKLGIEEKIKKLIKDGIIIKDNKVVNLEKYLFYPISKEKPLRKLREYQEILKNYINVNGISEENLSKVEKVYAFDVHSYEKKNKEISIGVLVEYNLHKKKHTKTFSIKARMKIPYIPTYLSYREYYVFHKLLIRYENEIDKRNSIFLFDGNGVLHPRKMGLATFIGILENLVSIGVAKKLLCGRRKDSYIYINNEKLGYILKLGRKEFIISPGNKINLQQAIKFVKKLIMFNSIYPLKLADKIARKRVKYEKEAD